MWLVTVNGSGCAPVLTNFYSAPLPPGTRVEAKAHAAYIEIWHDGKCVARHERCFGRQQKQLQLEHYLDAWSKKPGALAGSMPLEQCRAQGRWPESFDHFWAKLEQRHGKQEGTRAMVDVLLLGRDHGFERLWAVVEPALDMGVSDVAAIRYLLEIERLEKRPPAEALDVGWLKRYERPQPTLQEYDSLLAVTFPEVIQ